MFKNPFSFEEKIRRLEYGLSMLIQILIIIIMILIVFTIDQDLGYLLFILFYIGNLWFGLAQSVKRSHDIGNSGWFILIPFYNLWLLFADGEPWRNKWGKNPKGIDMFRRNEFFGGDYQKSN